MQLGKENRDKMNSALIFGVAAVLALGVASNAAELPGKQIFEKTCKNCHGPEGKGNPTADSFFKVKIPRLNSDYVQKKSDEELKDIITEGRRKMEPVRLGQPVAFHKLPPQSVTDVIAYVRTLKNSN